jgi:hypothetical protein
LEARLTRVRAAFEQNAMSATTNAATASAHPSTGTSSGCLRDEAGVARLTRVEEVELDGASVSPEQAKSEDRGRTGGVY